MLVFFFTLSIESDVIFAALAPQIVFRRDVNDEKHQGIVAQLEQQLTMRVYKVFISEGNLVSLSCVDINSELHAFVLEYAEGEGNSDFSVKTTDSVPMVCTFLLCKYLN